MKNLFLAAVAVFAFASMSLAQNGQPIEVKAKNAAQAAGCFDDYNGPVNYQVTVVSACFAGGFVTEVLILPDCKGPECEYVRLGPLALVTFYCDEEVSNASVVCY